MSLIRTLLENKKPRLTDGELYLALAKPSGKGGLGKPFLEKNFTYINWAFAVNHQNQTAYVLDRRYVHQLAQSFKAGSDGFKQKPKNYALLLALLYYVAHDQPKDLLYLQAQHELSDLFLNPGQKITNCDAKIRELLLKRLAQDFRAGIRYGHENRRQSQEQKQAVATHSNSFVLFVDTPKAATPVRDAVPALLPVTQQTHVEEKYSDPLPVKTAASVSIAESDSDSVSSREEEKEIVDEQSESAAASQYATYDDFLGEMMLLNIVAKSIDQVKAAQIEFFMNNIHKLSLRETLKLSEHMMGVQQGTVINRYFNVIRFEQGPIYRLFKSHGNTKSWQQLFHILKTSFIRKIYSFEKDLTKSEFRTHKVELSTRDYLTYMNIMQFHTNRCYGRKGRTDSEKSFLMFYERNPEWLGEPRASDGPTEAKEESCVWNLR